MKHLIWMAAPILVLVVAVPQARADTWCIRDSGGGMFQACGFSSAQDCVRAALVGPGGICAREEPPVTTEAVKSATRKTAHRKKRADG
jgi:hypothetical protein